MREQGEELRDARPIAWCGCGVDDLYALFENIRKLALGQGCGPGTGLTGQARPRHDDDSRSLSPASSCLYMNAIADCAIHWCVHCSLTYMIKAFWWIMYIH